MGSLSAHGLHNIVKTNRSLDVHTTRVFKENLVLRFQFLNALIYGIYHSVFIWYWCCRKFLKCTHTMMTSLFGEVDASLYFEFK